MRNPLNSLLGTMDMVLKQVGENQRIDMKLLQSGKFSGEILVNLIGNILDFSKLRQGKMELVTSVVDVREKLGKIITMFESMAIQKGIYLRYNPGKIVPPNLETDFNKLNQIIINLLGNSTKFTAKGGVGLKTSWFPLSSDSNDEEIQRKMNEIIKLVPEKLS